MGMPKGRTGNPDGRPPTQKALSDALRVVLHDSKKKGGPRKARIIAEKLVDLAIEGSIDAIRLVWERSEGKAPQPITGDEDSPLQIQIVKFTDAAK